MLGLVPANGHTLRRANVLKRLAPILCKFTDISFWLVIEAIALEHHIVREILLSFLVDCLTLDVSWFYGRLERLRIWQRPFYWNDLVWTVSWLLNVLMSLTDNFHCGAHFRALHVWIRWSHLDLLVLRCKATTFRRCSISDHTLRLGRWRYLFMTSYCTFNSIFNNIFTKNLLVTVLAMIKHTFCSLSSLRNFAHLFRIKLRLFTIVRAPAWSQDVDWHLALTPSSWVNIEIVGVV